MTEPDETTRTPNPEGGDAPEKETAGTTGEEGRDAPKDETDYKALHLANKQTIEALTDKVAELAQKVGSQPATEPAAEGRDRIEKLLSEAQRLSAVDPVAALALSERAERLQDRQDFSDALLLQRLPLDKQKPMLDFYLKNRGRFADLAAASEAFNGREAASRLAQLEKELEEAKKKLANGEVRERDDVVRTHGRDVSTPSHKARTYTEEQFDSERERISREGGPAAARDFEMKLRKGEILLKG